MDGLPDESKNIAAANIIDGQDFIETNPNILINGDTLYGIFKIVGIVKQGMLILDMRPLIKTPAMMMRLTTICYLINSVANIIVLFQVCFWV